MKKGKNKYIIKAQKGVSKIIAKTAKQTPVSDFEKLVLDFPINGKGNAALWEAAGVDMSKYPSDLSERLAHMQKVRLNILQRGNPYQITNVADKYQITSYFPTGTSDNRLGYIHLNDNSDDEFGIRWVEKITPSMSKYGLDPYTAIGYNAAKQYSDIFRRGLLSGEELLQPGKTVPHVRTYFNTTVKRNPDGTWVVGKYHEPNEREAAARQLMASQNKTYVSEKEINDFLNRGEESKYVEVPAAVGEEWNVSSFPEYFDENGNFKKNLPEDLIDELSVNLKEGVPGFYQQYIGTLKRPLAMPNKLYTPFIHPYVYESGDLFRRMPNLGIFSTFKNGGTIKLQKAGVVPKILSKFLKNTTKPVLDKSLEGVPKVIEYTPKVIISEPYARLSRDLSTVNKAWSFSIDGDPFNTFQLVKDVEPKQYSVHFKTLGKNALTEPQKQQLFQAVADAIPGDSYLSTWGSVSKGGLAGLKRFEGLGFKPTLQTRLLGLKILPTAEEVFPFGEVVGKQIEVPILYKPKGVVAGSRPISEAELKGWPKQFRNQKHGQISANEYSGLPKGERNNGRYGDIRFIRHMDTVPELTEDGFVQIAPKRNYFANFTTDQLMVPHNRYPITDIGKNVLIINPEAFRGTTPFSLNPGDSFFVNSELKIKPKHVTFVSGDETALQLARDRGFNVITSPKLKILSPLAEPMTPEQLWDAMPALEKRGYGDTKWGAYRDFKKVKSDYVDELRRIINSNFSRPRLNEYSYLQEITGVPTNTYLRETAPFEQFFGPKTGYEQVIYDTTPNIEGNIVKQMGAYSHPMAESMKNWSPIFFRLRRGWTPIKNQGGKI